MSNPGLIPVAKRKGYCVAVCFRHGAIVIRSGRMDTPCPKCTGEITPADQALALAGVCDGLLELRTILETDTYGGATQLVDKVLEALCRV